jgi:hypothetical protein
MRNSLAKSGVHEGTHEATAMRHFPNRVESRARRQTAGKKNSVHTSAATDDEFSPWRQQRPLVSPPRQTQLSELAAEVVGLQRKLADLYPELARTQRLEAETC